MTKRRRALSLLNAYGKAIETDNVDLGNQLVLELEKMLLPYFKSETEHMNWIDASTYELLEEKTIEIINRIGD